MFPASDHLYHDQPKGVHIALRLVVTSLQKSWIEVRERSRHLRVGPGMAFLYNL